MLGMAARPLSKPRALKLRLPFVRGPTRSRRGQNDARQEVAERVFLPVPEHRYTQAERMQVSEAASFRRSLYPSDLDD